MKTIAITVPYIFRGEADAISSLLRSGKADRVHIRKPMTTPDEISLLIESITADLYPSLTIHDHPQLAVKHGLGGIHLNSRSNHIPDGWNGLVSRSLHSPDQISSLTKEDYAFLSPVYPSISKPGYAPSFPIESLRRVVDNRIIALGGVTPDHFQEIRSIGFGGVAMLGHFWAPDLNTANFRLQFITAGATPDEIISESAAALKGGCRWIQLRMKNASTDEIVETGTRLEKMCHNAGATFIIDDHAELVDRINADGVHIGKNDMPATEARKIIGPRKIIGSTANTFDDIMTNASAGADYIGLGPYRFTTTKKNLSPVLGEEGYMDIMKRCHDSGITLPVVAIGGITPADIPAILSTGVSGIALSGTIRRAADPTAQTRIIMDTINHHNEN